MRTKRGAPTYNPISVMDNATPSRLGPVTWAILAAALVMFVLGSKALVTWTNDLPISKASDLALFVAQTWQDSMDAVGIGSLADKIHDGLVNLQALRW